MGTEMEMHQQLENQGTNELPEWQIYRAYMEGVKAVQKPKMLDKLSSGGVKFSWCSLIFGPLYYLYRKQYLAGWLYFIGLQIFMMLSSWLPANVFVRGISVQPFFFASQAALHYFVAPLIFVLINIGMSFVFYPLYRRSAKRNYECWVTKNGDSPDDALEFVTVQGGVSWMGVILAIILNIVIFVLGVLSSPLMYRVG